MFQDPQSITINAVAQSLSRIKTDGLSSTYSTSDGLYVLVLSHEITKANRVRSLIKLTQKKVVTNPLDNTNDYDTTTIQITIDRPEFGWSATELGYLLSGLPAWVNSGGNVLKIYTKES